MVTPVIQRVTSLYSYITSNKIIFLRQNPLNLPLSVMHPKSNIKFINYYDIKKNIDKINKKKRIYTNSILIIYYIRKHFNRTIDIYIYNAMQKYIM
jgi:hypothetical protein